MESTVSVIVPVYNVENYLERCLTSISQQTYLDYEVILIDDGSTDNSGQICNQWCDKNSKFHVIHQENGGVSKARNKGLECVKTEYIVFVDPDDYIEPECLKILVNTAKEYNAEMVHCDCNGPKPRKTYTGIYHVEDSNFYETYAGSVVWGNLFKTEIVKKNKLKFREDIHSGEDTLFVTQYYMAIKKAVGVPNKLYYYEQESNGITKREFSYKRMSIITAMEALVQVTQKREILNLYAKRLLAGKTLGMLFLLWDSYKVGISLNEEEAKMIGIVREYKRYLYYDAINIISKIKLELLLVTPCLYKRIYIALKSQKN